MSELNAVMQINIVQFTMWIMVVVIFLATLFKAFDTVTTKLGIKFKSQIEKEEQRLILQSALDTVAELKAEFQESIACQQEETSGIKAQLERMRDMILEDRDEFIDYRTSDMRWQVINFAANLSNGMTYTEEQFNYVFKVYSRYKNIIEEKHLTNGQVDESMEYIKSEYRKRFRNG